MQAIYLIHQLTSTVTSAWRQRNSKRLSAALSRELSLADPRLRDDIQQLIAKATSNATPAVATTGSKAPTAIVSAARPAGGFRITPLPGLPTHMRYTTS